MSKESILLQLHEVESNVSRVRTLVEVDLADKPDYKVPLYCCMKARLQLENLENEFLELENKNKKLCT